jgi:hypothetical protein
MPGRTIRALIFDIGGAAMQASDETLQGFAIALAPVAWRRSESRGGRRCPVAGGTR